MYDYGRATKMAGPVSLSRFYPLDGDRPARSLLPDKPDGDRTDILLILDKTDMDTRELQLIDAFTHEPFKGNPAGVVLDAGGLRDEQMQAIAREVHASETAFVLKGEHPEPFRIRFFTPAEEVPLCGHATIATFHALFWAGRIPAVDGETVVHMEANAGLFQIRLTVDEGHLERVIMGQQPPQQEPFRGDLSILSEALGVDRDIIAAGDTIVGPPTIVSTGCRCLHVAMPDLDSVKEARPDYRRLEDLSREHDLITVQIVSLETEYDSAYAHVRTFAPAVGIDEDPVTGTAAGSLGGYLAYINRLPEGKDRRNFFIEQGAEVSRSGRIEVELQLIGSSVAEVWVGGQAAMAFHGNIRLPDNRSDDGEIRGPYV